MHIGKMIKLKAEELNISNKELMMALRCSRDKLTRIYHSPHVINTELLLKCCLLLKYDFFEEYSNYYKQINNDKKDCS
jgi:hypothetical protein